MIRRIVFALCTLLCAATAAFAAPVEPKPLAAGEVLRGRFVQERQLEGFARPLRTDGRFVLVGGKGLIWQSEKPFPSQMVITAAGILQLVGGTETMRLSASRLPFLNRFYDVLSGSLSGDWGPVERDFAVERRSEGDTWIIVLTPRRADDPVLGGIGSITVHGTEFVDQVEIKKAGGDFDRLNFLDQGRSMTPLSPEDATLFAAANK